MTDRDERTGDPSLDARLQALPRGIEPSRDLWPAIATRLESQQGGVPALGARRRSWLWQAAAAVVLVAGSSLLTAKWMDHAGSKGNMTASTVAPADRTLGAGNRVTAMPAAFGPHGRLDPEYMAARRQLTMMLQQRLAQLSPSTRAKLEMNLGEMRRAADEINAALSEQPGDPLLEELLLATYQDELAVLANVNQLTADLAEGTAKPAAEKRMKL
jgi:hypothetical protein